MADNSCMDPQGFNENSGLRASDADRDRAAGVINNALAEGRLTAEEHSDRLDAIYAAKTHADLQPLLADLPDRKVGPGGLAASAELPVRSKRGGRIVAILAGSTRKGAWHPDPVIEVLTVLGGAELDFRDAVLPGNEVTVRATSILGGVEITVPPEMRVVDNGIAILGGREITGGDESVGPDSPVLRIEGICVLGGIEVKRKSRKRKGERELRGGAAGLAGDIGLDGLLSGVRDRHREIHDQMRERHREIHDQMRERRRGSRDGTWSGDDD